MTTIRDLSRQARVQADPPRGLLWWTVVLGLFLMVVLGCSGLLVSLAFHQYSPVKWGLTAFGPAVVLLLFTTRRALTLIAAAAVVLLPFSPFAITVHGTSIRLISLVLVAGVVVAFLSTDRAARPGADRRPNRVGQAAVVVALLLVPSAVRGLDPGLWFIQLATVASTGYVVSRACRLDRDGGRFVLAALAGSMGLQGLLAVREFQTGRPFSAYGAATPYGSDYFFSYEGVVRPSGSFFDPISLGNVLAYACPMLLAAACHRGFSRLLRLWFALCGLAAAGALVLTLSRMSWVGAVVGMAVVVLLSNGSDRLRQIGFLAVGAVIVSGTAVALAGPALLPRFNSIFHPTATGVATAGGDETRQQLWRASYEVFSAHPLFGVGTGNLHGMLVQSVGDAGLFGHAHSTYLQNLAEGGVIAGAAILVLAIASFSEIAHRLRATRSQDLFARACAGALVALAVVWTTDVTVRYTTVLTCMALPFILLIATRREVPAVAPGRGPAGATGTAAPAPELVRAAS